MFPPLEKSLIRSFAVILHNGITNLYIRIVQHVYWPRVSHRCYFFFRCSFLDCSIYKNFYEYSEQKEWKREKQNMAHTPSETFSTFPSSFGVIFCFVEMFSICWINVAIFYNNLDHLTGVLSSIWMKFAYIIQMINEKRNKCHRQITEAMHIRFRLNCVLTAIETKWY